MAGVDQQRVQPALSQESPIDLRRTEREAPLDVRFRRTGWFQIEHRGAEASDRQAQRLLEFRRAGGRRAIALAEQRLELREFELVRRYAVAMVIDQREIDVKVSRHCDIARTYVPETCRQTSRLLSASAPCMPDRRSATSTTSRSHRGQAHPTPRRARTAGRRRSASCAPHRSTPTGPCPPPAAAEAFREYRPSPHSPALRSPCRDSPSRRGCGSPC